MSKKKKNKVEILKSASIVILLIISFYLYYQKPQPNLEAEIKRLKENGEGGNINSEEIGKLQTKITELENELENYQKKISWDKEEEKAMAQVIIDLRGELEEIKTKLGEKTLDKLLEENDDREDEVDRLTRFKKDLEGELENRTNTFQTRLREKDRGIKQLKEDLTNLEIRHRKVREDLTSEKKQNKSSLEQIKSLAEQITSLESEKSKLEISLNKGA